MGMKSGLKGTRWKVGDHPNYVDLIGCIKDFGSGTMKNHFIISSGGDGDTVQFVFFKKKKKISTKEN